MIGDRLLRDSRVEQSLEEEEEEEVVTCAVRYFGLLAPWKCVKYVAQSFRNGACRAGRPDAVAGRTGWSSRAGCGKTERRNPCGGAGGGVRR